MNHDSELASSIPIVIELAPGLDALLGAAQVAGGELERDLAGELRFLGLHGRPIVEPLPSTEGRAIRIRVHDQLQPYPAAEMARAWAVVTPPELSGLPAASTGSPAVFRDEWFRAWAERQAPADPSGPGLAAAFMRELVRSVILQRPACLVGPGQVEAFLAARPRALGRTGRDVAERDARLLLRSLLALGLSVADADVVWAALRSGWRIGRAVEDTVEAAAAALRPNKIEVYAHPSLLPGAQDEQAMLDRLELNLFRELGIRLPKLVIRATPELPERAVRVRINHLLGAVRSAPTSLLEVVAAELRERGCALVGIEDVEYLLSRLDGIFPELVSASLERLFVADLTRVLRALVAERLPIRDIRAILERLLQFDVIPLDPLSHLVIDERLPVAPQTPPCLTARWRQYLAFVRAGSGLRNLMTQDYGEGGDVVTSVPVIELDRELEGRIRAAAAQSCRGTARTLDQLRDELLDEVGAGLALRALWPTRKTPALLVADPLLRPLIRELTAGELPHLPVVVSGELRPDVVRRRVDEAVAERPGTPTPGRPADATAVRPRRSVLRPRLRRG
jgi:hypothetical protein